MDKSPMDVFRITKQLTTQLVHAYASNSQHRLPGTLGAWVALYGEWSNLTNSDQIDD